MYEKTGVSLLYALFMFERAFLMTILANLSNHQQRSASKRQRGLAQQQ